MLILLSLVGAARSISQPPSTSMARMVIPAPDPKPAIHGPKITGATPGRWFLFRIPATGQRPMTFSVRGLPAGLKLGRRTGFITGALKSAGTFKTIVTVRNDLGSASRPLTIVGGDHKLALTPPMGWNTFNIWAGDCSGQKVKEAADWMVKSGLADHGYQYVDIDDCWEADQRGPDGELGTNAKFPNITRLIDYIHGLGLKVGIYSSPGPKTCKGLPGSYQHEEQDARMFARWGIDLLKYDWCSYTYVPAHLNLAEMKKPFFVMRAALDKTDRDMVYSLSQAGVDTVWKWGPEVGANMWRTSNDIKDNWRNLDGILHTQHGHEEYASPGHWNDPDMLVVGVVGWGDPRPSRLAPDEQLLHMTMWCMWSAPLIMGCDLSRLDPFTFALLSNDEAIDVDQDALAKPASRRFKDDGLEVWARPLSDGTTAVALVNLGTSPAAVSARWSDIGVTGAQPVRDLWLHRQIGTFNEVYSASVPAHGAVMLKVGKPT